MIDFGMREISDAEANILHLRSFHNVHGAFCKKTNKEKQRLFLSLLFLHPQVQYMLESDSFDSVQELVRFYVGQRKPVSQSSGVHIYCPVSRTLPLRYLEATFALANSKQGSAYSPSSQRGAYIKRRSVTMTDGLTTEKMIPHR